MFQRRTILLAIAFVATAAPGALCGDRSGSATLTVNTFFSLDTGAGSGFEADVLWDGAALIPQGRAGLHNLGKYGARAFRFIRARHAAGATYSAAPIPAGTLVPGDVFGVHTNGGNYAKAIVTAVDGDSLSLQYTTFSAAASTRVKADATSSGPAITMVQNNYSYILPGLPNYGIAPGSLFTILGTGLSVASTPVLQSSVPGLPQTLNQTSVAVTVNGVTTTPALYYTSATAVAAVLPSATPLGNGTVTVTYNGQTSAPAPIQVVASAVGLDTFYGTGNGTGVATDLNGNLIGFNNSAMPGQILVVWGSGIGADPGNDDRTYPQKSNNLTNIPTQFYFGGVAANILYRGRSPYPGVDQYNVVVPAGVSPGCFVSVVAMTGSVVSNAVTLAVSPNGGACSDPATGLTGSQLQSLAGKAGGNVNSLLLGIVQTTANGKAQAIAAALPAAESGAEFGKGYEYASQGSCTIVPPEQASLSGTGPSGIGIPLDAGAIQMTGPAGQVSLNGGEAALPGSGSTIPAGAYTFTGSGGKDVGSFQAALNVQTPLTLTNVSALASITRSLGATVTWSGGFPNGDVQIEGDAGVQYGTVRFYCHAPSSAGQFAIPPSILLAMPPGGGALVVSNTTAAQKVSASGLDIGLAVGTVLVKLDATYK
jgi:uncharacterized protein (TIGR03437 family)